MFHYQENIVDSNGTALNGWSIDLFAVGGDPETAPAVAIYSDRAGTTAIPGSKVRAVSKGLVEFYVPSGRYSRRYFDTAGELQYTILDSDMDTTGGDLASTATGKGASGVLTTRGNTVQAELDYLESEVIDFIDFGAGVMPTKTRLGRTVNERVNGPTGTLTRGFDANGFYVNTNPTGRGGAYVVVDAGEPVTYQYAEFIIKSGGTASPDQATYAQMAWMTDITQGTFQVPLTAAHQTISLLAWGIDKIETVNTIVNYANGLYPSGYLSTDTIYRLETCYIDDTIYRFINGQLMTAVTQSLLSTLQGNFAGFEIFKNNTNDNEPGMRRLAYSTSKRVAMAVRDRYLVQQSLSSAITPDLPYIIRDDFISGTVANGTIGAMGWGFQNFTPAAAVPAVDRPGILALQGTNVAGTVNALFMGPSATVGVITMDDVDDFVFEFRENAAGITDYDLRVGFMSAANTATPNSWIGFEKLAADANWWFVSRASGVQTRVDTGVAAGTNAWLTMRVRRIKSTEYRASINGSAEVAVTTNVISPAASVLPVVMTVPTAATSRRVDLDFFSLSVRATTR